MKTQNIYKSFLFIALFLSPIVLKAQVRIITIGDSTMANYEESAENETRGWGQMLPMFMKNGAIVQNEAKNGRSSKSFYHEIWESLRNDLKVGDYVFIQFGHNDEKAKGLDTDENDLKGRGTAAWGQYQQYLEKYVSESRAKGAIPILFTSVVRRMFDKEGHISDKGLHNLTEFASNDSIMNYPKAMRHLAHKLDVPLIDMTLLTKKMVEEYGADKSKAIIYVSADDTHLQVCGAKLFAYLAVEELLNQKLLLDYLKP